MWWFLALSALLFGIAAPPASADEANGTAEDKEAIAKSAEAFVEAFHKGDAEAVAAFWAPDGDFTDQIGRHVKGREAIAKALKKLFADYKGLKVRTDSESLRFVTPDVAVEDGTTEVVAPEGGPPSRARYTIVHVKKNGKWLLSSVRNATLVPPSNYEHLRRLEGLIGEWSGKTATGETE
jgi:uncharacterized protein (TIGR02246 family)